MSHKIGDLISVPLEGALKPMVGRLAKIMVEGEEVTARLSFVNMRRNTPANAAPDASSMD